MKRFTWVVLTNCDPEHESEFNRWYDDVHLADLLRIPGVVSAKRARLSLIQMTMAGTELQLCDPARIGAKYSYLACYSIETDDIGAVFNELKNRSNTPGMVLSEHMTEAYTMLFEDF